MKKRFLSLLLSTTMVLSAAVPSLAAENWEEEGMPLGNGFGWCRF